MRIIIRLAYDGTDFHGWARQPKLRSVQETLEAGLQLIARTDEPPRTVCAGRTDAGVHAHDQWVHVDLADEVWAGMADRAEFRLRAVMPPDIHIKAVHVAPQGFDARFSPLWRRYSYRVCDASDGIDPLRRREVLPHHRQLDASLMHVAAQELVGTHDFAAYCKQREGATTIRGLQHLSVVRQDDGIVRIDLQADAFCHSMVRSIVGALLLVGDGRKPVEWPGQVLATTQRDPQVPVVGAQGLVLEEVVYPDETELAARAQQTRAWRSLEQADDEGVEG